MFYLPTLLTDGLNPWAWPPIAPPEQIDSRLAHRKITDLYGDAVSDTPDTPYRYGCWWVSEMPAYASCVVFPPLPSLQDRGKSLILPYPYSDHVAVWVALTTIHIYLGSGQLAPVRAFLTIWKLCASDCQIMSPEPSVLLKV